MNELGRGRKFGVGDRVVNTGEGSVIPLGTLGVMAQNANEANLLLGVVEWDGEQGQAMAWALSSLELVDE